MWWQACTTVQIQRGATRCPGLTQAEPSPSAQPVLERLVGSCFPAAGSSPSLCARSHVAAVSSHGSHSGPVGSCIQIPTHPRTELINMRSPHHVGHTKSKHSNSPGPHCRATEWSVSWGKVVRRGCLATGLLLQAGKSLGVAESRQLECSTLGTCSCQHCGAADACDLSLRL